MKCRDLYSGCASVYYMTFTFFVFLIKTLRITSILESIKDVRAPLANTLTHSVQSKTCIKAFELRVTYLNIHKYICIYYNSRTFLMFSDEIF